MFIFFSSIFDLFRSNKKYHGVGIGIVVDNADSEALGRIKVKFPWLADENVSHWARVFTLMAGDGYGTYFLPEINDEVLVAFENGDLDHPYVIGPLWSSRHPIPDGNGSGQNNIRKIKTRSGHELIFDDNSSEAKEKIKIKSHSGHQIIIDDTIGQEKIEIIDKSQNNAITIDATKRAVL